MPNFIPYLLLVIASVLIMTYLLIRTKSYYTFVFFISLSGLIYFFEYVIVVLLNAYRYVTGLLPTPFLDSMLGALVSNLFTVPSIAVFFAIMRLRMAWSIVIAFFLTGVEWLFVKLHIFEHNWWALPYTTASVLIILGIAWLLRRKVLQGSRFSLYILLLMFSFWLIDNLTFYLSLSGIRLYVPGVFEQPIRDDSVLHVPFSFFEALLITSAIYWTRKMYWLIGALIAIFASTFLLIRLNISKLFISEWLFFVIYLLCCVTAVTVIYKTVRWCQRHSIP